MDKYYITTSIAYTNAPPHCGFALELIQADVLARYNRLLGKEVFFLTGTDEHGKKNLEAAQKAGKSPQEFVDLISAEFKRLAKVYNISIDNFIRTSDQKKHWPSVFKVWNKLFENGDLYRKKYKGLYCVGHEAFIKKSELVDGLCPLHLTKPDEIEEENWFFRLTKYKKELKRKLENDDIHIVPEYKLNELLPILDELEDISFSRPKKDISWGIPVPNDDSSYLYIWPEALTNYISAIGYADETDQFKKFWPADVHLIGKDILRFHAIYWPAMLLSLGLPLPKNIFVHGFITSEGQKMSKTIGNIVDPFKIAEKYGIDPVRYYLLREIPSDEDGNFSVEKLEARYNGDLANNLGNLVSRLAKLIETKLDGELILESRLLENDVVEKIKQVTDDYHRAINNFKLHEAVTRVWELLTFANGYIDEHKPWIKDIEPDHLLKTLTNSLELLISANRLLEPFLPETSEKILKIFGRTKDSKDSKFIVEKTEPLFPRLK
ncbi:MAG: methionine--tRNA ligase [Minisyncoccia bacterium]